MPKKLTIGLFIEHYDPFVSGAINSIKSLRYELEAAGHKVYIICPSAKGFKDSDPAIIRTRAFTTKFIDNTSVGFSTPGITHRLMDLKFDIIHAQDIFFVSLLGLRIARAQQAPYIQTIHTLWDKFFDQYPLSPIVYAAAGPKLVSTYIRMFGPTDFRRVFINPHHDESAKHWSYPSRFIWQHTLTMANQAQTVIVPSIHQKLALEAAGLKVPVKRITNSFPPFEPQPPVLGRRLAKRLRILCVARLSHEKRVDSLITALHRLNDNGIELVIVGDGTDRPNLEKLVIDYRLTDNVMFMGTLPNQSVRQLMRESDALALASYNFDTQPMVFDEALDAGLPIIYCDPKFVEAVSPANALLVKKDPAGFAAGFRKLKDEKLRDRMAKASVAMAKDFRSSHAAAQILKVYRDTLKPD